MKTIMGGIIGDVVGSIYEFRNYRGKDFELMQDRMHYTDDTVLTIAVADALVSGESFTDKIWNWANEEPNASYGGRFYQWMKNSDKQPYNSFGNGSAMRVGPVGYAYDSLKEVLEVAKQSAECTHNHPEGIKGAQATAAAIFYARIGKTKAEIKAYVEETFGYDLSFTVEELSRVSFFDETCQGTVPDAIIAFLESNDFEDAIRTAISIGGDSDTIACITGSIAAAYYDEIPQELYDFCWGKLTPAMQEVIKKFDEKYDDLAKMYYLTEFHKKNMLDTKKSILRTQHSEFTLEKFLEQTKRGTESKFPKEKD